MISRESPFATIARFQGEPPVDVERLADAFGLVVYYADLGPKVSAKIQRDAVKGGLSGFAVYVNSREQITRQRFSIAHEIAHYILHRDLIKQGVTDDTMYRSPELSGYYETQANQLAADILMPSELVKRRAQMVSSLDLLAMQFQVSKAAMKIKLESLKIQYAP